MKTQLSSTASGFILFCLVLFLGCTHKQVKQFNVDLQLSNGNRESHAMTAGSMLLVNDGDMHILAKVISGTESELELQVTRYSVTHDSIKGENTIQKAASNTNKLTKSKNTTLDPSSTVQVTLQSMAMIDTGNGPVGACKGNCCEATCFSTFCCIDPDECKNAPCDCKGPSNCPGQTTGPQAVHFFELFMSGKDMMVFKD